MKKPGITLLAIGLWGISFLILTRLVEVNAISSDQRIGFMMEITIAIVGLAFYLWPEKKP